MYHFQKLYLESLDQGRRIHSTYRSEHDTVDSSLEESKTRQYTSVVFHSNKYIVYKGHYQGERSDPHVTLLFLCDPDKADNPQYQLKDSTNY